MNEDLWDRVERMCIAINPEEPRGGLLPPATLEMIEATERAMKLEFPADLRQAYLRFNGMGTQVTAFPLLPSRFAWLSVGEIGQRSHMMWMWQFMSDTIDQERNEDPDFDADRTEVEEAGDERGGPGYDRFLDLSRIMVANGATSDGVFVDTKPARAGTVGQLIHVDPQCPTCTLIAPSFTEAVRRVVSAHESGLIHFDPDELWLFTADNRPVMLDDVARFT